MIRSLVLGLSLTFAAGAAWAQLTSTTVTADLDGDGIEETFSLIDTGEGSNDLSIEGTALGPVFGEGIAWSGTMIGQQPELAIAPDGSVRVISMNESVGRDRWKLTLTLAFREGVYLVAGYTFEWRDTVDEGSYGICDVNLLTGQGEVTLGDAEKRGFTTTETALDASLWRDASFGPNDACFP